MSASYINDLLSAGSVWFVWLIARSCAFFASPKRIGERRSCKSAPWHSIPCQSMRYERNLFWSRGRGRGRPLSNQRTIRRLFMRLRSKICDFYRPFNEPRCPDPTWRSVSIFSFRPPPSSRPDWNMGRSVDFCLGRLSLPWIVSFRYRCNVLYASTRKSPFFGGRGSVHTHKSSASEKYARAAVDSLMNYI